MEGPALRVCRQRRRGAEQRDRRRGERESIALIPPRRPRRGGANEQRATANHVPMWRQECAGRAEEQRESRNRSDRSHGARPANARAGVGGARLNNLWARIAETAKRL